MRKVLIFTISLFVLCGIFTSCSKENKNKVTGSVTPPVVQPNDPTIEEIINSTGTFNSTLYEIDQIMIADNLITSDVASITVIPDEYLYFLSFRIKDKNSDSYAWRYVTGAEWDIKGSTIVVKGLNGLVIWPNVFYSDEPQTCQISISFKGLTYNRGLTFKTTWTRPLAWEEQFAVDYTNDNLNNYTITIESKISDSIDYKTCSLSGAGNFIEIYDLQNLNNWDIYIDGHLKTELFTITVNDQDFSNTFHYVRLQQPHEGIQGFKTKNGKLLYRYDWHFWKDARDSEYPGPYTIGYVAQYSANNHKCNVVIYFSIKSTNRFITKSFKCCE